MLYSSGVGLISTTPYRGYQRNRFMYRHFFLPPRPAILLLVTAGLIPATGVGAAPPTDMPVPIPRTAIAALGRVEPISEEIRIAAAMTGRLADVPLEEGDPVKKGQVSGDPGKRGSPGTGARRRG
jgi:multidrug efflux pump subunit AcrA (membrane-fusion protein)